MPPSVLHTLSPPLGAEFMSTASTVGVHRALCRYHSRRLGPERSPSVARRLGWPHSLSRACSFCGELPLLRWAPIT
eukprot:499596-Prorocentrum_minimum.AAC.1